MIKEAIAKLVKKEDLTAGQMNDVMEEIMTGEATDAQKAAFLTRTGYSIGFQFPYHELFCRYDSFLFYRIHLSDDITQNDNRHRQNGLS